MSSIITLTFFNIIKTPLRTHILCVFARFIPILAFFISFLLLLCIDSTKLVKVIEQRSYCIIFHIPSSAYLKWLKIMYKVIIDYVDPSTVVNEFIIRMWLTIHNWFPLRLLFLQLKSFVQITLFCALYKLAASLSFFCHKRI